MPRCPHAVATNELFTPFYICGGTKVRKKYICPSIFGVLHSKREAFSICRHMFLPLLVTVKLSLQITVITYK